MSDNGKGKEKAVDQSATASRTCEASSEKLSGVKLRYFNSVETTLRQLSHSQGWLRRGASECI